MVENQNDFTELKTYIRRSWKNDYAIRNLLLHVYLLDAESEESGGFVNPRQRRKMIFDQATDSESDTLNLVRSLVRQRVLISENLLSLVRDSEASSYEIIRELAREDYDLDSAFIKKAHGRTSKIGHELCKSILLEAYNPGKNSASNLAQRIGLFFTTYFERLVVSNDRNFIYITYPNVWSITCYCHPQSQVIQAPEAAAMAFTYGYNQDLKHEFPVVVGAAFAGEIQTLSERKKIYLLQTTTFLKIRKFIVYTLLKTPDYADLFLDNFP